MTIFILQVCQHVVVNKNGTCSKSGGGYIINLDPRALNHMEFTTTILIFSFKICKHFSSKIAPDISFVLYTFNYLLEYMDVSYFKNP